MDQKKKMPIESLRVPLANSSVRLRTSKTQFVHFWEVDFYGNKPSIGTLKFPSSKYDVILSLISNGRFTLELLKNTILMPFFRKKLQNKEIAD